MIKSKAIQPALAAAVMLVAGNANALTIGPDFAADYTVSSLGSVPNLPPLYGGLTFKLGDPNTILIGGNANTASGLFYEVPVVRGADNHITGFSGSATPFGSVGEYNDGGVTYGPGNVLFTAQWPVNNLGQTKPGATDEDRVDNLGGLGIGGSSISAIGFVPNGFDGAGGMKIVSWASGNWYDVLYTADGSGTFNLDSAIQIDLDPSAPGVQSLPGGPEGFVFIDDSNPGFLVNSLLVSDYSSGTVSAYDLDAAGNPLVSTRRAFITELTGAEGAVIDPLTGDFLFSTFGGGNQVVVVQGFTFALGEIAGIKWEDLNGDGQIDLGEALLDNWVIELLDTQGSVIDTQTTDADGSYRFTGVSPGSYFVRELLKTGWEQTFDATGGRTLSVAVGQSIDGINFGNRPTVPTVPEPATLALLGLGIAGMRLGKSERQRKSGQSPRYPL